MEKQRNRPVDDAGVMQRSSREDKVEVQQRSGDEVEAAERKCNHGEDRAVKMQCGKQEDEDLVMWSNSQEDKAMEKQWDSQKEVPVVMVEAVVMQQRGDESTECPGLDYAGKNEKEWPEHDESITRIKMTGLPGLDHPEWKKLQEPLSPGLDHPGTSCGLPPRTGSSWADRLSVQELGPTGRA